MWSDRGSRAYQANVLGYFCDSASVFLDVALRFTGALSYPPEKWG